MFELKKIEAEWRARMHKALSFDGVDDYVEVPDSPSLDVTTELTIVAWIYTTSDNRQGIATKRTGGTTWESYLFDIASGRKLWFNYRDSTGIWQNAPPSSLIVPKDEWCFVGVTFNNGEIILYKNLELQKIGNFASSIYASNHPVKIGYDVGSYYFNGIIAQVNIYNRALSESEIKYLYHNPFDPIDPEHLVLWLNPAGIDVANSKWWDLSGKGNHGTIYGATEVKLVEEEIEIR